MVKQRYVAAFGLLFIYQSIARGWLLNTDNTGLTLVVTRRDRLHLFAVGPDTRQLRGLLSWWER